MGDDFVFVGVFVMVVGVEEILVNGDEGVIEVVV